VTKAIWPGRWPAYRESLAVRQRLARRSLQCGLAAGLEREHTKLGDVLSGPRRFGAGRGASGSRWREQRLAAADPSNAGWQHDLTASHDRMGDVLSDQGDLAGALAATGSRWR